MPCQCGVEEAERASCSQAMMMTHLVPRRVTTMVSARHEQQRKAPASCPAVVGVNTKSGGHAQRSDLRRPDQPPRGPRAELEAHELTTHERMVR
mmetsp:Transcript_8908/g.24149  ORF Transcript_8908/g.24149 Transcript_8908/m.24149 type:complete len:94 (+) Transcript_8908:461-742(+)